MRKMWYDLNDNGDVVATIAIQLPKAVFEEFERGKIFSDMIRWVAQHEQPDEKFVMSDRQMSYLEACAKRDLENHHKKKSKEGNTVRIWCIRIIIAVVTQVMLLSWIHYKDIMRVADAVLNWLSRSQ